MQQTASKQGASIHKFSASCSRSANCIQSHTKSSRARRGFLRGIWGNETKEPQGALRRVGRGEGIDPTRGAEVPVRLGCRGLAQTPLDCHSPQAAPGTPGSAPNCTQAAPVLSAARPRTRAGFRPVWDCTFCDTESTRARRGDKRVKWGCGCIGSHHRRMDHGGVGAKCLCRLASDSPTASKGTWEANGRGGGSCAVLGCATRDRRNWSEAGRSAFGRENT